MNIRVLPLEENVIDYLVGEIKGLRDFSRVQIVFAGHRPALFLNTRLAKALKRPFEPPAIVSFEDMLLELAQTAVGEIHSISPYELMNIVYNLIPESNKMSKFKNRFSGFFSIYKKVVSDYEQIVKSNSFSKLETAADSVLLGNQDLDDIKDYIKILYSLWEYITHNRCYTSADYYRIVSELSDEEFWRSLSRFQRVYLVDIIPLYETEITILKRLSQLENVYFVYQSSSYLNRFDSICNLFKIPTQKEEVFEHLFRIYESPDIHGEVLKLKEIILTNPEYYKNSNPNTMIMLPNADSLRVLDSLLLCELPKESYNVSLGIPLSGSTLVSFMNLIFESLSPFQDIDGVSVRSFSTLIRHPIFSGIRGKKTKTVFEPTQKVLDYLTGQIMDYIDLEELDKVTSLRPYFEELREPLNIIYENLKQVINIGGFAEYVCNIVKYISTNSVHTTNNLFQIEAEIIYRKFRDIANSPLRDIKLSRLDLMSVFNSFVSDLVMRPKGSPLAPLQVLGLYEARSLSFENIFILDFNDENIFDYSFEDSFLLEEIKRRLNLPSFSSLDDYLCYFLDILIRQSKNVYLFYRSQNKLTKNRYLLNYIYQMKKRNVDVPICPIKYNIVIQTNRAKEIAKDRQIIEFLQGIDFSPTILNTYYNCPAKFYYNVVAGIEETEDVSDEPDNLSIGIIVHNVLRDFFNEYKQKNLKVSCIKNYREMKDSLLNSLDSKINFKSRKRFLYKAIMELISENIQRLQEELIKKAKDEYKILKTEEVLSYSLKMDGSSIKLKGSPDRVERIDDYIVITDYKLAKASNYEIVSEYLSIDERMVSSNGKKNIQLPFYVYLLKRSAEFCKEEKMLAQFLFLKSTGSLEDAIKVSLYSSEDDFGKCSELIENLIGEVLNVNIPFFPIETDNCTYCVYSSICRANLP